MKSAGTAKRRQTAIAFTLATALLAGACGQATVAPPTSVARSTTSTTQGPHVAPTRAGWSIPRRLGRGASLTALQCPTATFCLAGDDAGHLYRYDGASWSKAITTAPLGPPHHAIALSCADAAFCAALVVGANRVAAFDGRTWTDAATIVGAHGLQAVSCATSRFCVTIDAVGDAFYFDGSSWSPGSNDWGSVQMISCRSRSFCASVSGGISTFNGGSWSEPSVDGATTSFSGVSCPTAAFCVAVDASGQVLGFNGAAWHPVATLDASVAGPFGATADLTGVSCSSPTRCVAVDNEGDVFSYDGQRWSGAVAVDAGHALTAVSCAQGGFCAATDARGAVTMIR